MGWTDADFEIKDWLGFMGEVHKVLEEATGRHFGVARKVSTHAWAYPMVRQRVTGRE